MPHVEMVDITKRFGDTVANDHVTIDFRPGEIHALLGENGAGKTTLMNILYGLYRPDSGRIEIEGRVVPIRSPQDAIGLGIGMVHQHFMLVPTLTVTENFGLGQEPAVRRWKAREFEQKVVAAAEEFGLPINPRAIVAELSVGQQQRVEIVRALGRGATCLILDEPTAVLTPQEVRELMAALRRLAARGTSVVFISHKLKEVMEISHRVSVLRFGRLVQTVDTVDTNHRELAMMMVGRQEFESVSRRAARPGQSILEVRNLAVCDDRGHQTVRDISFEIHAGEIVGVAGVDGNGQTELCESLIGLRRPTTGSIQLEGREIANSSTAERIRAGLGYVPDDRILWGLFPGLSVAENLISERHASQPIARNGFLNRKVIDSNARDLVKEFDIRPDDPSVPVGILSGGNKQKVIVSRVFSRRPRAWVIHQPTRGLDVGATEHIRQLILDERDRGAAILLISADLDEVFALSDRLAVIYEGRFTAVMSSVNATRERVGLLMAGLAYEADQKTAGSIHQSSVTLEEGKTAS